ncbi:hypothetical protein L7F22_056922 [Adiantum nelumboides]|nr:hypothetical protein [Adiantum nelumboides]
MYFMASEVRTTIMSKLYGDHELFLALRAFLNGELKVGLPPFAQVDGINNPQNEEEECVHDPNLDESHVVEIPINNLGKYFEGDESNATLPITCEGLTMKEILDGGARVSIVTRNCWETMGKPHLGVTNIVVQMANGTIAKPIVRFDLTSGRMHPLGKRFIIDNRSDTTIHSAPLKYCHTCKKDTDVGENPPYLDILPGMDESDNVDWVHLAATIDTWGNRGTTWVTPAGNQIPQFVPLNMIRAVSAHSENPRTEILTDEETSSIFEGCDSCDLMVESTIETSLNSELDEEVNTGSSSTPSDNLSSTEEDSSEDHSTDFALGTTHNYKLDKKCKKYKRRRYRANVRAKMNKKQSIVDWLCYLGALDAHRKLVDNWGDRKVVYTKAQRTPINGSSGVYDGPAIVKEIELAEPGEESKPVFIAQDLTEMEEAVLKELLKEFKDIFAWTYHDMKGIPPSVVQHTIPMISTAKPVQQRPYPMNPKYAKIVQEELEKLIECGFIYPIEHSEWVSPIVIVPKKNEKLRVTSPIVIHSYPLRRLIILPSGPAVFKTSSHLPSTNRPAKSCGISLAVPFCQV